MTRSVAEWIAKHDDAKIPPRVRDRIFTRDNGVCHWCRIAIKVPVETWQADHVKALVNGGEHRETNLAPIHSHCHVEKTGIDTKLKAKIAKTRQAHRGIKKVPVQKIQSAKTISERTVKNQSRERIDFTARRNLYREEIR